jgi:hypothetical protein
VRIVSAAAFLPFGKVLADDAAVATAAPNSLSSIALPSASGDNSFIPSINVTKISSPDPSAIKSAAKLPKINYLPRVYLSGYGGVNKDSYATIGNYTGKLDILLPVFLRFDKNLFLYGQGNYALKENTWQKNSWAGSLGLGYRQFFSDGSGNPCAGRIFGLYLLGDYNSALSGNTFMDINPGIETLGERWDFRINGYIPIGKKKWKASYWASDLGDYSYYDQESVPHEILDSKYNITEVAGTGGDAEFGLKLFSIKHMPLKLYVDGYYYDTSGSDDVRLSNVFGGGGRLTFQPTPYLVLEARYTYDNYRNNELLGGIRINLNGLVKYKQVGIDDANIQARLYDQIERNFGTQANGNTNEVVGSPRHAGPAFPPITPPGPPEVKEKNVWYFDDTVNPKVASGEDDRYEGDIGTYQNPYSASDFNQGTIDSIESTTKQLNQPNAELYLKGGNSGIYNTNGGNLNLYPNMDVYGKSANDYKGSDNANIYGGLTLEGNNTIDHVIMNSDGKIDNAITISLDDTLTIGSTINLQSVQIKNASNGYKNGIYINSGKNINIVNVTGSSITAQNGIVEDDSSNSNLLTLLVDNTTIMASTEGTGTGIIFNSTGALTLENTDSTSSSSIKGFATGIKATGGDVTVEKTTITSTSGKTAISYDSNNILKKLQLTNVTISGFATGINVSNSSEAEVIIAGSKITAQNGIVIDGNSNLQVDSTKVISTDSSGIGINISNDKNTTLIVKNGSAVSGFATGIKVNGSGNLTVDNTSITSTNGNTGIAFDTSGNLTLQNGSSVSNFATGIRVNNSGDLTVDKNSITSTNGNGSIGIDFSNSDDLKLQNGSSISGFNTGIEAVGKTNASLTVNSSEIDFINTGLNIYDFNSVCVSGSTIKSTTGGTGIIAKYTTTLKLENNSNIDISGSGSASSTGVSTTEVALTLNSSTINIHGSSYSATGINAYAGSIYLEGNSKVIVNINAKETSQYNIAGVILYYTSLTAKDSKIEADLTISKNANKQEQPTNIYGINDTGSESITLNGGSQVYANLFGSNNSYNNVYGTYIDTGEVVGGAVLTLNDSAIIHASINDNDLDSDVKGSGNNNNNNSIYGVYSNASNDANIGVTLNAGARVAATMGDANDDISNTNDLYGIKLSGATSSVTLYGGTIEAVNKTTAPNGINLASNIYGAYVTNDAKLDLKGGTISARIGDASLANTNVGIYGIYADKGAIVDLYYGEIDAVGIKIDQQQKVYGIYGGKGLASDGKQTVIFLEDSKDPTKGITISVTGDNYEHDEDEVLVTGIFIANDHDDGTGARLDFTKYYNNGKAPIGKQLHIISSVSVDEEAKGEPYGIYVSGHQTYGLPEANRDVNYYITYTINTAADDSHIIHFM